MSELPRPISKATLITWSKEQIQNGMPRWVLYRKLMKMQSETNDLEEMQVLGSTSDALEGTMVNRNIKGIALEKQGKEDQAMALYEANIVDQFDGSHPYNRLCALYKARGNYMDASRVCEAYIANSSQDLKLCELFRDEISKLKAKTLGSATQ